MFPFARVPFWGRILDPQPNDSFHRSEHWTEVGTAPGHTERFVQPTLRCNRTCPKRHGQTGSRRESRCSWKLETLGGEIPGKRSTILSVTAQLNRLRQLLLIICACCSCSPGVLVGASTWHMEPIWSDFFRKEPLMLSDWLPLSTPQKKVCFPSPLSTPKKKRCASPLGGRSSSWHRMHRSEASAPRRLAWPTLWIYSNLLKISKICRNLHKR